LAAGKGKALEASDLHQLRKSPEASPSAADRAKCSRARRPSQATCSQLSTDWLSRERVILGLPVKEIPGSSSMRSNSSEKVVGQLMSEATVGVWARANCLAS
jgi:hypothetical protein